MVFDRFVDLFYPRPQKPTYDQVLTYLKMGLWDLLGRLLLFKEMLN